MTAPAAPLPRPSQADPDLRDGLMALFQCGVRLAQVEADIAEVEHRVVAVVATVLPATLNAPASAHDAHMAGLSVDRVDHALNHASPRLVALSQGYERTARAVRRTAALVQRLDTGWRPRGATADDRPAMARRQVARAVGERIARHAEGEAAERLFDDLDERLDELENDGALDRPVEDLIEAICRDLDLAQSATPEAAAPVGRISAAPSAAPPPNPDG